MVADSISQPAILVLNTDLSRILRADSETISYLRPVSGADLLELFLTLIPVLIQFHVWRMPAARYVLETQLKVK